MIGKTILHYKITEKLGEGGMGVVYKAEDTKLERTVALKFLSQSLIGGKEENERFKREARAAAALNHPNIAHVYAVDEVDGQAFIAMEFIEGQELKSIIDDGPLSLNDAIDYATQISAGLQAAHEKGVVHRDIKSANIMVTDKGVVKIMDFGLAKLSDRTKMTMQGTTLGTAAYMSPEQAQGAEVDHRSDIWSFGVVLYEMLAGQMPFKGDYEQAVIYSILHQEPEPLTALRSGLPIALDGIVAKTLAKDPKTRYQHVDELPADLKTLENGSASRSRISAVRQPFEGSKPSKGYRYQSRFWTTAGLLLAAIAVALWGWLRPLPTTNNSVTRFSLDLAPGQRFARGSGPAISPDGQRMAYPVLSNGSRLLYVRQLDSFDATLIAGGEGAREPFFSPDGKSVGFHNSGKMYKVSFSGGPVTALAEAPVLTGATWGPDNTIVFAPGINTGLWRVSAGGGQPQEVTRLDLSKKESSHGWPRFLPGGKTIIFTIEISGKSFDEAKIVAQVLASGERKVLIEGGTFARYLPTGHLLFARSDALYAVKFDPDRLAVNGSPERVLTGVAFSGGRGISRYAVADNGALLYLPGGDTMWGNEIVLLDRNGSAKPLVKTPAAYFPPRLSPDGRFVTFPIASSNNDLWLFDTQRQTQTRLTFEGENVMPIWSADGGRIFFGSDRGDVFNLYSVSVDGSGALRRLTTSDLPQKPTDCSPDGRFIAFQQQSPETGWDIWLLPLTGEGKPRSFRQTGFNETRAVWSPDGRWLAYQSDESGQDEIYVEALDGNGKRTPISVGGGRHPKWSPKGGELFYLKDNKIIAVKISTESGIVAGRPRALFRLPPAGGPQALAYDLAPDGEHFVVLREATKTQFTRMNVVLNWFKELRRKMQEENR